MSAVETHSPSSPSYRVALDEELRLSSGDAQDEAYRRHLGRLSHASVVKHFDAYADIDWDAPEMRIDPADPRWELDPEDSLARTAWYQSQPPEIRSAIGLHMIANFMKLGLQFESVLKRGLLDFAWRLPNGSPEFRYVYHEVIEEAQHSLMFQEFVNRTKLDPPGLPAWQRVGARLVVRFARTFPELFFIFVLGGEDPIDHVQREMLRGRRELHPLFQRISQIHVTEEARHLSFARLYLRRQVPRLGAVKRALLRFRTPLIMGQMAQLMMRPSRQIVDRYSIPAEVLREAYKSAHHRKRTAAAIRKVRDLCVELDVVTPRTEPLWRAFGLMAAQH